MKTLHLHYQTDRKFIPDAIYYPEDERTPEKRVAYVIALSKQENPDRLTVVSACPYIIEGFIKLFEDREIKCYLDEQEVAAEKIFNKMAIPMQKLAFV